MNDATVRNTVAGDDLQLIEKLIKHIQTRTHTHTHTHIAFLGQRKEEAEEEDKRSMQKSERIVTQIGEQGSSQMSHTLGNRQLLSLYSTQQSYRGGLGSRGSIAAGSRRSASCRRISPRGAGGGRAGGG